MTVTVAKWSVEDYHRMIAAGILDNRQVELLQGEIVEMAPEGEAHAYSSDEAGEYLAAMLGDRAKIRQAKPVTLPNASEPEPDIAIVQRLGQEYRSHHPYSENIFWVIEYSDSSLAKDLDIKTQIYAQAGISEYWVVNLKDAELVIFRQPENGTYTHRITLTEGTIQPLSFPDVRISVAAILNC